MGQEQFHSMMPVISADIVGMIVAKRGVTENEAIRLLYASKLYEALEQEENKLLLLRGDRMYEEATGDVRQIIEAKMTAFEGILDKQNKGDIEKARTELKEFLDSIEEDIL